MFFYKTLSCASEYVFALYTLTFTAWFYLPPYMPHLGPLDPITCKEAALFTVYTGPLDT